MRAGGQTTDFLGQHVHQIGPCIRPAIGESVLEMVPDALVGIQLWGIGWKRHQVKAAGTKEEFLDRITAVDLTIVPHDDQLTRDLLQEIAQKQGSLFSLDVVLVDVAVQCAVEAPRADGDTRDGGDAVVTRAMPQDRCLACGAPRLAHGWNQEEAGFVDEDDMGRQPGGVFFTAGQTVRFQCAIAPSSRSTARRSGFWWLHPNWCKSLPT
jgi:hypothetical protein